MSNESSSPPPMASAPDNVDHQPYKRPAKKLRARLACACNRCREKKIRCVHTALSCRRMRLCARTSSATRKSMTDPVYETVCCRCDVAEPECGPCVAAGVICET